jgi:hypothetical protein
LGEVFIAVSRVIGPDSHFKNTLSMETVGRKKEKPLLLEGIQERAW